MIDYQGEAGDYRSLSDFFARKLDPEKRPLVPDESAIVSPADGEVIEMETIFEDRATQVKGKYYMVSTLLKEDLDFSNGWHVATIYLSPFNYHRYHYPLSGKIDRYYHTGGRLFPVNQVGLTHFDKLFLRNERIITRITRTDMPCYMVAIGATFVGSIQMEFIKKGMAPPTQDATMSSDKIRVGGEVCFFSRFLPGINKKGVAPPAQDAAGNHWKKVNLEICQLEEMGRFDMGSTIVLVMPKKMAEPINSVKGKPIRVGQPMFKLK
jgi:phosphatidylserine decarboxylase